ncbi:hypothetical protein K0M31_007741 [Melipona bicolor]|uniref:Uncharacterized protein n=1 Tax=Melipona bicolor TaxID=60889 RepID=A0AA40GDE3_9HYME|nr:hypothetical protein K0M31_007741 [Melipona bicolor]
MRFIERSRRREENEDYWKLIRQGGLPLVLPFEQGYRIIHRSGGPPTKRYSDIIKTIITQQINT